MTIEHVIAALRRADAAEVGDHAALRGYVVPVTTQTQLDEMRRVAAGYRRARARLRRAGARRLRAHAAAIRGDAVAWRAFVYPLPTHWFVG